MAMTEKEIAETLLGAIEILDDLQTTKENSAYWESVLSGPSSAGETRPVPSSTPSASQVYMDSFKTGLDIAMYIPTAMMAAKTVLASVTMGTLLPVAGVAIAGLGLLSYLDYKFKDNTYWVYESEKQAKAYQESIAPLAQAYKERTENVIEAVEREVEQTQKLLGCVEELRSYLDKDGNIVSNPERAVELYQIIKKAAPNEIQMTEDGRIEMGSPEPVIEKTVAMANAAAVLQADIENYEAAKREFAAVASDKAVTQEKLIDIDKKIRLLNEEEARLESIQPNSQEEEDAVTARKREIANQKNELKRERKTQSDRLDGYYEQALGLEKYLKNHMDLEVAFKTGDTEGINAALEKYDPDFRMSEEEKREKLTNDLMDISATTRNLEAAFKAADQSGFAPFFKEDLTSSVLNTWMEVARGFRQLGTDGSVVNNMLAQAMQQFSELGPSFEKMARDAFGEEVGEIFDKLQAGETPEYSHSQKGESSPEESSGESAEEIAEELRKKGMTEAEIEAYLTQSMQDTAAKIIDEKLAEKEREREKEEYQQLLKDFRGSADEIIKRFQEKGMTEEEAERALYEGLEKIRQFQTDLDLLKQETAEKFKGTGEENIQRLMEQGMTEAEAEAEVTRAMEIMATASDKIQLEGEKLLSDTIKSITDSEEKIKKAKSDIEEAKKGLETAKSTLESVNQTLTDIQTDTDQAISSIEADLEQAQQQANQIENTVDQKISLVNSKAETETAQIKEKIFTDTEQALENASQAAEEGLQKIREKIQEGVQQALNPSDIEQSAQETAENTTQAYRESFEINSPSKLMARKVGAPLAQGIGVGFQKEMKQMHLGLSEDTLSFLIYQGQAYNRAFNQNPFELTTELSSLHRNISAEPSSSSTYSPSYTFNSPKALDYREMRQEIRRMDQINRLMARS